jgi:outer membrane protein assembly factor BamA
MQIHRVMQMRLVLTLMSLFAITISAHTQPETVTSADTVRVLQGKKKSKPDWVESYVQIQKILVTGNRRTRENIILRELRLKEGDIISESDLAFVIKKDQQKLFNLHLFNTVSIDQIKVDSSVINLQVRLEERWFSFPVPRFQLSDRNFNEWWQNYHHDFNRVNYGLKLYQYNLWGRNHTLLLKTQFGFQHDFQLVYRMPYINKKQKEGLVFEMDYMDGKSVPDSTIDHKFHFIKSRDVLRTTKSMGVTYTYRKNFYSQHRIKYQLRSSSIADSLLAANPNYFGSETQNQQYDALTYEIATDRNDVSAYPLKGYAFLAGVQQIGVAVRHDLKKTSAYIRLSGYLPLGKQFYLSNMSYAFWSNPDKLPYYNYSTMGYDKIYVRGYEIYVIEGPKYFLNKTTLKKRLFSGSWHLNNWSLKQFNYLPIAIYLKTYADFGYVNNYRTYENAGINTFLANKLLTSAGFGLDILTGYDLAIRFEYTFTPETHGFFLHFRKEF